MRHAHAQHFMVNDELLPPLLKVLAKGTRYYVLLELRDIGSLCLVAELSVARSSSSPVVPTKASSLPASRQTRPPPRGDYLVICCASVHMAELFYAICARI